MVSLRMADHPLGVRRGMASTLSTSPHTQPLAGSLLTKLESGGATHLGSSMQHQPMQPPLRRDSAFWKCLLGHTFRDEPANS